MMSSLYVGCRIDVFPDFPAKLVFLAEAAKRARPFFVSVRPFVTSGNVFGGMKKGMSPTIGFFSTASLNHCCPVRQPTVSHLSIPVHEKRRRPKGSDMNAGMLNFVYEIIYFHKNTAFFQN
jgi:hypothetical protein